MTGSVIELIIASLLFCGGHFVISSTGVRPALVARLGEKPYMGLFSVFVLGAFLWMLHSYDGATYRHLWVTPDWVRTMVLLIMPVAIILLIGSLRPDNPSFVAGQEEKVGKAPAGIFLVTRHPMFWGVALFSVCHMLVNGDLASQIFFGTFLVLSLGGTVAIDAKFRSSTPEAWTVLSASSSNIPLAAVIGGKVIIRWGDLRWPVLSGLIAYMIFLGLHQWIFGVSPFPAG